MKSINNKELLQNKNLAGIILRPNSKELKDVYLQIKEKFEQHQIKTIIDKASSEMIGVEEGYPLETLANECDFLVTIGGDGTLISVARRSIKFSKPILGINLGTLGFLTSVLPEELDNFLGDFLKNNYAIDSRMMIKATINKNKTIAFNDIVIKSKSVIHMVNIEAFVDGKKFNSYYGDGLVVSTPTGSTAYNLSSGGPVVYPLTDAFIVTPISAHSLTQRPLVLPADFEIELKTPDVDGAIVLIDGQDTYELKQNETVKIKIANQKSKLIRAKERDYFSVLNQKLNWGK
ncbi:MAG: NAD(+)/NADH kinase [Arcobacteraceae bacterium]|jgi:NAD+ kinase|nr:NAD(+)/NADH kinase [Arcobacteraceae bacterium]